MGVQERGCQMQRREQEEKKKDLPLEGVAERSPHRSEDWSAQSKVSKVIQ